MTEPETHYFILPDGRKLAYVDFGPEDAHPVFYFHGCPSCRYEGEFPAMYASKYKFRIIALDRPGMGNSDFQQDRKFTDWPNDVMMLASHLGFDRFGVAGHSGGGPFVFACAYAIPERLTFAIAFCPWGPVQDESMMSNLNFVDRVYLRIAQNMPWLMRLTFSPLGFLAKHFSKTFFAIMKKSVSPPDKLKLSDNYFFSRFARTIREAFNHGSRGAAYEAAMCYRKWDFELSSIKFPVSIWAGEADIWIPAVMVEYMTTQIRDSSLHKLTGKGHLCVEHWEDAFAFEFSRLEQKVH